MKIRVGMPAGKPLLAWGTCISHLKLQASAPGVFRFHHQPGVLPESRNEICRSLAEDDDYILFLDDDMRYEPEDVAQLLAGLQAHPEMGAISGFYRMRNGSKIPLCGWKVDEDFRTPTEEFLGHCGDPRGVDWCGAGLLLVTREAIQKTAPDWFRFEYNEDGSIRVGEDNYFIGRLKAAGYQPSVHFGVRVGHLGEAEY